MRYFLLIGFAACVSVKNPPPPPTATTAMMFFSDFAGGYEVKALDVETREQGTAVSGKVVGTEDAFVRIFNQKLYVVSRSFMGQENAVTVVSPDNDYRPTCEAGGGCQWQIGFGTNPQDLWAVSEHKAYITINPSPFARDQPQYQKRNILIEMNPETGEVLKEIDLLARIKGLGVDVSDADDENLVPTSLFADDKHLFISLQMRGDSGPIPAAGECGFVPSRVAVLDYDTDEVVAVIKLRGSNANTRFVPEYGTDNLLIGTAGSLTNVKIDDCHGIERINQRTLTLAEPFINESALGGSVMAFAVGADGNGIAFTYVSGTFEVPVYEVAQFNRSGKVGSPLLAPAADALLQPGFVIGNDRGEAYIGLAWDPATGKQSAIRVLKLSTGELVDEIDVDNQPIDIALYPGTAYSR